ncbi:MAG: hypothetical protein R3B70_12055 [Polyangiaceae bacterium]
MTFTPVFSQVLSVQSLPSSSMSRSSGTDWYPDPLHTTSTQSPGVCVEMGVPCGRLSPTHVPSSQNTNWHSLIGGMH